MSLFQDFAILIVLAALSSYLNHRFLRLPATIGLMVVALSLSVALVLVSRLTAVDVTNAFAFIDSIDFSDLLLHGMLAFLLFAGGLHVKVDELRDVKLPVAVLPTVGVVLATGIIGGLLWLAADLVGLPISLPQALLFGALISPTDPIAVLGVMKQVGAPKRLENTIAGESLFNDGVGVVLFLTLLGVASGSEAPSLAHVAGFFVTEAAGGLAFGLALGWLGYRMLRTIDQYSVEIFLTLAIAAGGYAAAEAIHVSAPITVVAAGLVVGSIGREGAMSQQTREHLDTFWELVDEMLNAVLFLLIGLEMVIIELDARSLALGALAIGVVLLGRLASVWVPALAMRRQLERGTLAVLTWGGLRGGISIALALSIPVGDGRESILAATYVVVVFSILVQGLTLARVIRSTSGCGGRARRPRRASHPSLQRSGHG